MLLMRVGSRGSEAESAGGVGLRIAVNEERADLCGGERCGEIYRGRGLADAALLVRNSDDSSHGDMLVRYRIYQGRSDSPVVDCEDFVDGLRKRQKFEECSTWNIVTFMREIWVEEENLGMFHVERCGKLVFGVVEVGTPLRTSHTTLENRKIWNKHG